MKMDEILVGHNKPPDMADTVAVVASDISDWMSENPIVESEEVAREAKVFIDRAKLAIADLETERTTKVKPLNEQVKAINDHYRTPRELLERVANELKSRMDRFLLAEEAKRIALAQDAERRAKHAEEIARQAEQAERDAIDAANSGVLGLDIKDVTANADKAFAAYQKAERQAAIAERETKVKIGGGFTRALSLREKETLTVTDIHAAIKILGEHEYIVGAVIKASRVYRKLHGCLPDGVESNIERKS